MKRPLCLMVLALLLVLANSCASSPTSTTGSPTTTAAAPAATTKSAASPAAQAPSDTAKATTQAPKYGGTLNYALPTDVTTWDDASQGGAGGMSLVNQELWTGDWTKGAAGGSGTKETDWAINGYDIFSMKTGSLAESWQVNVDNDKQQATVVYKLRPGVHWALNPKSPASVKVGGRELAADDVLAAIKQATTDPKGYVYRSNPELRNVDVSKTGPLEITIKVPLNNLVTALSRFGDSLRVYPVEVRDQMADWKNSVGTGPFMLTDYVPGSKITYVKNPNFWMKDPIGPGKGNQLPYLDGIQEFVIPDASTRLTAFRTAKIDQLEGLTWEDANQAKKDISQALTAEGAAYSPGGLGMYMRTDKPPFNDVRVRRALMMATDFNSIKQTMNNGLGQIITFPYDYYKEYAGMYVGLDDPELPASVKEQFVYSPDKAKQLLAEAGYPNGFKTSVMTSSAYSSYYEVIAGMWAKVGVTLAIDLKDPTVLTNLLNTQAWDGLAVGAKAPVSIYYSGNVFNGVPGSATNVSFVDDPDIKETLPKVRQLAATNEQEAMKLARQMMIHALDQAWAIQVPGYRATTFWWPWLKNYSGEISVGYFNGLNWSQFVWLDQDLRKSMGF